MGTRYKKSCSKRSLECVNGGNEDYRDYGDFDDKGAQFGFRTAHGGKSNSKFQTESSNLFTFVLVVAAILLYDFVTISKKTFDIVSLESDLVNNVHNQTESVNVMVEALHKMISLEQKIIVTFVGSTGVGKTFTANILKKYFHSFSYELCKPFNDVDNINLINGIVHSKSMNKLLIIDDLTLADSDQLLEFLNKVPHDSNVVIVCIFNIQETDANLNYSIKYEQVTLVKDKFVKAEIDFYFAQFYEFDHSNANAWIRKQLTEKGVNRAFHDKIVEKVLFGHDLRYHGLKGLGAKLNLEV